MIPLENSKSSSPAAILAIPNTAAEELSRATLIDDNYTSPLRQLQIPTGVFHCSDSFPEQSCREIPL
jgi:hypothetical protein